MRLMSCQDERDLTKRIRRVRRAGEVKKWASVLTQEGNGLKLIYRRSRAEGGVTKTRRSHPRYRLCCQRPPNTKTGTKWLLGVDRSRRRTASLGGGFPPPTTKYLLGVGGDALASPSGRWRR